MRYFGSAKIPSAQTKTETDGWRSPHQKNYNGIQKTMEVTRVKRQRLEETTRQRQCVARQKTSHSSARDAILKIHAKSDLKTAPCSDCRMNYNGHVTYALTADECDVVRMS